MADSLAQQLHSKTAVLPFRQHAKITDHAVVLLLLWLQQQRADQRLPLSGIVQRIRRPHQDGTHLCLDRCFVRPGQRAAALHPVLAAQVHIQRAAVLG